jgi:hypothetical protein
MHTCQNKLKFWHTPLEREEKMFLPSGQVNNLFRVGFLRIAWGTRVTLHLVWLLRNALGNQDGCQFSEICSHCDEINLKKYI